MGQPSPARTAERFGSELRLARTAAGLTQRQLALRVGRSQTLICGVERGERPPPLAVCEVLAAAVGCDLSLKLYPRATVSLRDSGQLTLANTIVHAAHSSWHPRLEVPIRPGDLRAADLVLSGTEEVLHVEIERRLTDFQAQLRAAQLKRRELAEVEDRPVRLLLAIPDTRAARRLLAFHEPLLARALPTPSRRIWRSIVDGLPVGADGILLVPGGHRSNISTG